jgi:DNA-binding NarL/FixJ family response regulator
MHFDLVRMTPVRLFASSPGESDEGAPDSDKRAGEVAENARVLIVEDESLVAMNMELALVEAGFLVIGVVDTEKDAIEAAQRLKPDVVLMDITLRDGDGLAAAAEIYRMLQLPVVFVTGNTDMRTLDAIKRVPSFGLIRKPFVSERLAALVRDAVAGKR